MRGELLVGDGDEGAAGFGMDAIILLTARCKSNIECKTPRSLSIFEDYFVPFER